MGGNMDNLLVYISLGILVCCQTSWGKSKWEQNPSADRFNFFDTELFEMLNRNEDGNVIISPLSIKTMLGMIMEGAENESEKQIRTALRLSNDRKIARKEFSKWMHSLTSAPSNVILKIANKLFLSHKFSIQQEYRSALENDYLGDVTKVKFEEPVETAKLINDYINNQTGGLIPSLVDETQLDAKTELLLTNAIYFKGNWMNPFPKDRTIVKCFYPIGDECKKTNMMTDSGWYKYAYINQLDAQAIELPYQDKKFSMVILLPNKHNGIKQLTRDIIHIPIGSIFSELREKEVYLQLPRFSAEYKNDLSESLKSLQITDIFSQKANLTRILTDKNETLFVSKILHAAKIIVNEEGSEAAAATGAIFVPLMGSLRVAFTADHPFLFFIRDTTTNTTLFAGKVSQPEEASQDVTNTPQEGPVRVSINQKPYESAHQIFYQEIFTPSPPISNGVQKENSYVMRKPGRLPPPPSPTGLPNGFLSQNGEVIQEKLLKSRARAKSMSLDAIKF